MVHGIQNRLGYQGSPHIVKVNDLLASWCLLTNLMEIKGLWRIALLHGMTFMIEFLWGNDGGELC
jgi:hypothetical protein